MTRPAPTRPPLRALTIVLILFGLLLSPWGDPGTAALRRVLQPFGTALFRLGIASSPFTLSTTPDYRLQEQTARADILQKENQQLRNMLAFSRDYKIKSIGADIIGRSLNPIHRRVRINRGMQDGVRDGHAVVAAGYVVGMISRAETASSEVMLITDPDFRMTATVGSSSTAGIAKGALGGMSVTRLLQTEKHVAEDTVYTSNADGLIVSGLPLGKVRGVRDSDTVFREVDVESPISLEQLQVALVIIGD